MAISVSKMRGNCNKGLGMFKDNPYRLKLAVKYLEENETRRKWRFQPDEGNYGDLF